MRTLAIIPCGKKKIWDKYTNLGPVNVNEAYIGTYHRLSKQYANQFCDQWVVLSGLHGYMLPNEIVPANYDVTFNMKDKAEQIITLEQLNKQVKRKKLDCFDRVIALTGKKHMPYIERSIPQAVEYPLLGTKGIGEIQQKLKRAIQMNTPLL
ncbi:DUF6884 domain-containing protein [Paraliobacillus ryukyuensis]|uniref:DUF6884 domain-containing protein n=1 Tax=Paraliobacillus ryukyuensis TaxID=200904 RepID=UPI0009A60F6E|nr:DUF6884 domain-containing protein [Paraliobacillus ryukyuensis]